MLRDGRYVNEMTRYRFDVTLHIGMDDDVPVCPNEEYWDEQKLDIASAARAHNDRVDSAAV